MMLLALAVFSSDTRDMRLLYWLAFCTSCAAEFGSKIEFTLIELSIKISNPFQIFSYFADFSQAVVYTGLAYRRIKHFAYFRKA